MVWNWLFPSKNDNNFQRNNLDWTFANILLNNLQIAILGGMKMKKAEGMENFMNYCDVIIGTPFI